MSSYYVRHSRLELGEDKWTEFKGHRLFSDIQMEQIPYVGDDNKRTRRNVSIYVCGMLNTGEGGTILLGVLDDGCVEGLMMNQFQRDHFVLTVQDTLEKFNPPVPPHLYSIKFVPVLDSPDEVVGSIHEGDSVLQDDSLEHLIGVRKYCWCDASAMAALNMGIMNPFYVIEFKIHPWSGSHPKHNMYPGLLINPQKPEICPIFQSDDGKVYIRRNATNEEMSESQVASLYASRTSSN